MSMEGEGDLVMHPKKRMNAILLALAAMLLVGEVHAVVGRPATPVSYAGAARRTVRR
jgi:hypothetical protein